MDPDYGAKIRGDLGELNEIVTGRLKLTVRDRIYLHALHDQDIRNFDDKLKVLLDKLIGRGLLQNVIIVLIADHVEESLDHVSALHDYTLYELRRSPKTSHLCSRKPGHSL